MGQELFEWALLLGRWLHITVAIAWIGASIFFMWLDRTLEFNEKAQKEGHVGELWMVHGGGFYHVEKMQMGPTKVPEHLHWFKWESYWTWLSGLFLLLMIFYTGNGTFLLDSSVSQITFGQAICLSVFSMIGSWLFYDFLWERKITKTQPVVGHVLTLLWLTAMTYFLCQYLSGRAAYIHIGAMLGTWMTANVFLRIIPRQVKMVEATLKGEPVNQDWGKNAKNRSTHNTYFTLPVIFIMLSNHFPATYGHDWNWLILLLLCAAGAAIREFFVVRLRNPLRARIFAIIGVALILGVIVFTSDTTTSSGEKKTAHATHISTAPSGPTGQIKGLIQFEGPVPKGQKLVLSPDCTKTVKGDVYSDEIIVKEGRLKNVLVRITGGLEGRTFGDIPAEPVKVDQRDCIYEPRIVGVRAGQKVEFINSDPTFHNVRSFSKANESFNVAMPSQNDRIIKVFEKPEDLQTRCSVHPWMSAGIAVMDHPFFSVTGDTGEFLIKDLPVGDYTLEVWHETLGTQVKKISIKENEVLDLPFSFKQKGQP